MKTSPISLTRQRSALALTHGFVSQERDFTPSYGYNAQVRYESPPGGFFVHQGNRMKLCKTCRSLMIGEESNQALPNLETLLEFHGFTPKTLSDVALSLGPMCEKCLNAWSEELTSA